MSSEFNSHEVDLNIISTLDTIFYFISYSINKEDQKNHNKTYLIYIVLVNDFFSFRN